MQINKHSSSISMRLRSLLFTFAAATLFVFPFGTHAATNKTVGAVDTAGIAQDVVVVGNYAYVADGTNGVVVIDVTNPAAPVVASTYDTPGDAKHIEATGNILVVADGTSVQLLSILNPSSLSLLGSYSQGGFTINDVTTDGTYAYVLGTVSGTPTLQVINIANSGSPVYLTQATVNGANDVVLAGTNIFTVGGKYADILSAYPSLGLRGTYTGSDANTFISATVFGSYAYINDFTSALHVVNFSNPAAPTMTYGQTTAGQDVGGGIVNSNGYIFVTTSAGLSIYDFIVSPSAPVYVDAYSMNGSGKGVTIANTIAVIAEGLAGIQIVDVSQPDSVPPTVTPAGDTAPVIIPGKPYVDPGVTVGDNVGGTGTSVSGTVDTSKVGRYTITYTVTDRGGNTTIVKRVVTVGPTIEKLTLKNNTYTLKVGAKNVVLKPFGTYRGAMIGRKIIVDKKTNPFYVFIATDAMRKPELVMYNASGKVVARQNLTSISTKGLQLDIISNPATLSVFIATAPKANGLTATIYNISKSGFKSLKTVTAAKGSGTLVMKWVKGYANEYVLATLVKGSTAKPLVWRYSGAKKSFIRDTKFVITRLLWTKTSIKLK